MERILTVKEATVQTVQVEIKALKVGKKQVTMGLFRQLPYQDLLDVETLQLRGVPWGHVNYWWENDGCSWHQGPRLHVVWQRGDELRRAAVHQEPDRGQMVAFREQLQNAVDDWFLVELQQAKQFIGRDSPLHAPRRDIELDGKIVHLGLNDETLRAIQFYWDARDYDPSKAAEAETARRSSGPLRTAAQEAETFAQLYAQNLNYKTRCLEGYYALLRDRSLVDAEPRTLQHHIRELVAERDAYKVAWAQQWQTLCQLPQLFIAV